MISDFEVLGTPNPSHTDVCIVGAGGAGILLAVKLAHAGRTVTLLEGGGMQLEPSSQELYQSHVVGRPYQGIHNGRFRTYGGTTTEWGGQILELDEIDFIPRREVPGSGWPLSKSELIPYYEEATRTVGLSDSLTGDQVGRQTLLKQLRIADFDVGSEFVLPFSRWCPQRNFAVLHRRTLQDSKNLFVYLHANVVEILLDDQRTFVHSVRVRTLTGREICVTANHFVLCMGGIETTRLLLQPAKLGTLPWQATGVLGRYYQDNISCDRIPIRDISITPVTRHFGFVASRGFHYQTKIQLAFPQQVEHKTLNVAASISPYQEPDFEREQAARALRRIRDRRGRIQSAELLRTLPHLPGIAHNWILYRLFGGALAWRRTMLHVHCEQSPLSDSTITLSDERDSLGMFRSRVKWRISTHEIESIRAYVRIAERFFRERGIARVEPPPDFLPMTRLCSIGVRTAITIWGRRVCPPCQATGLSMRI